MRKTIIGLMMATLVSSVLLACAEEKAQNEGGGGGAVAQAAEKYPVTKSDAEWKRLLAPDAYHVLRQQGTERAFTGKYDQNHEDGVYYCAACGQKLFDSHHKFNSGTGWPSFYQPIDAHAVGTTTDKSFGMARIEVHCSRCGGHLGHVFDDGPKPTGLRYCMNSVSLTFRKRNETPPQLLK